jgi:uncharacterized membrane protein
MTYTGAGGDYRKGFSPATKIGLATAPNSDRKGDEIPKRNSLPGNLMPVLRKATPERLTLFSDGVFAVLITVLVLELRPPEIPTFEALREEWPTGLSYLVSYLFIAIVWTNHHYLMRYADEASPRLLWFNFAHLFSISLIPLSTAWMAVSELAPQPVAFYAAVFFLVNATYVCLIWELIDPHKGDGASAAECKTMRFRSIATLCLFGAAAIVALRYPLLGLGICMCCLVVYLRPGPPEVRSPKSAAPIKRGPKGRARR